MTLKKSGFLMQVAYFGNMKEMPDQVHLCQFGRKLLVSLMGWPFLILVFAVLVVICGGVAFLFGRKLTFKNEPHVCYVPFWLPKIGKWRILPLYPILIAGLVYCFLHIRWPTRGSEVFQISNDTSFVYVLMLSTAICTCFWCVTSFGKWCWKRLTSAEFSQLVKAYIKGKQEKVCPIIDVVD